MDRFAQRVEVWKTEPSTSQLRESLDFLCNSLKEMSTGGSALERCVCKIGGLDDEVWLVVYSYRDRMAFNPDPYKRILMLPLPTELDCL